MHTYQRIVGVPGLSNAGIMRGGQIYRGVPTDYQAVKDFGIKTILDLREENDTQVVRATGLLYFTWPLNVLSNIEAVEFDELMGILNMSEYWPILVRCRDSVDRTGTVCAAYRISQDGWALEDALEEMEQYGAHEFMDAGLKACLQRYADHLKEKT